MRAHGTEKFWQTTAEPSRNCWPTAGGGVAHNFETLRIAWIDDATELPPSISVHFHAFITFFVPLNVCDCYHIYSYQLLLWQFFRTLIVTVCKTAERPQSRAKIRAKASRDSHDSSLALQFVRQLTLANESRFARFCPPTKLSVSFCVRCLPPYMADSQRLWLLSNLRNKHNIKYGIWFATTK